MINHRFATALVIVLAATSLAQATEPNETFATRTILSPGTLTVSDTLTEAAFNFPDTQMVALDQFGQLDFNYFNDDNTHPGAPGNGLASGIYDVPTNSGSIDFLVSGTGDDNFDGFHNESGSYEVFIDAYDLFGDLVDRFSEIRTLAPGVVHQFHFDNFEWLGGSYDAYIDNTLDTVPGDVDFFTFTGLTPGAQFAARTADPTASGIDTLLGWFDGAGSLLVTNDDGGGNFLSLIEGTVPTGGMLTFAVTGSGDTSFTGQHFSPGSYELRLQFPAAGLDGDYNGNNVVDAADYVLYRNTFGQTGSGLAADGNHNGQIDPGDFTVWRANFGRAASGATAGLSGSAVPEPASFALLTIAAALLTTRRRGFASSWRWYRRSLPSASRILPPPRTDS